MQLSPQTYQRVQILLMHLLFSLYSLLDSSHGGSYGKNEGMTPLDQQSQFFGELKFPVQETEAWGEKVSSFYGLPAVLGL